MAKPKIPWWLLPKADEIRRRISENRKGKGIGNQNRKGKIPWNKGISKELQPRYGKPASQKQIESMRRIGKLSYPAWNKGISEWSPRLHGVQSAKALARDGFKCIKCSGEEQLVVHHIKHWKQMDDKSKIHELDNLQTLCRKCHLKIHNFQKNKITWQA